MFNVDPELHKKFIEALDRVDAEYNVKKSENKGLKEFIKKEIKGFCRVCGKEQEMHLDFFSPSISGFSYTPCNHSVRSTRDKEEWFENGFVVPESELYEENK